MNRTEGTTSRRTIDLFTGYVGVLEDLLKVRGDVSLRTVSMISVSVLGLDEADIPELRARLRGYFEQLDDSDRRLVPVKDVKIESFSDTDQADPVEGHVITVHFAPPPPVVATASVAGVGDTK